MAVVGEAYVVVRALPTKFKGDIEKILRDTKPTIDKVGKEFGESFADSFGDGINRNLAPVLDDLEQRISDLYNGLPDGSGAFSRTTASVRELGDEAESTADKVDDLGDSVDRTRRSSSDGGGGKIGWLDNLTKGAGGAAKALDTLIFTGNILGPAISSAVGAVGALGASLFSLASAAAQAGPALAVIPGFIGTLIQGFGALAIATQGVGKAISEGIKTATNGAATSISTARSQIASARAIESAQRGLRDAYQRAADSAVDSAERVRDAQQGVVEAQNRVREAENNLARAQQRSIDVQERLTQAREDAAERLQQLQFDAEDAALGEERAAMRLQEAYAELQATQNQPVDSKARQEAELAYKEADLAYRRAKDRSADLAKTQEEEAAKGVEGSKEVADARNDIADAENDVIDAKNAVLEATQNVTDAEERLTKAQRDQARAAREAAEGIADAKRALRLAQESARLSASAATGTVDKFKQSLDQLAPSAQDFVKQIVGMRPIFLDLRNSIADGLFPPITAALKELAAGDFFGILKEGLSGTGEVLGRVGAQFIGVFNQPVFQGAFGRVLENNNGIIEKLGGAAARLAGAFILVLDALRPLMNTFTTWITGLADGWAQTIGAESATGALEDRFTKAGEVAARLGGIIGQIKDVIVNLAKAAAPAGDILLDALSKGLGDLNTEIVNATKDGSLVQFFKDAAENAIIVVDVLGDFGRVLASFADNKSVGQTAEAFRPLAGLVKQIGDRLSESGPALSRFAESMGELVLRLTDSGQIDAFLNTLSTVADIVTRIIDLPFVAWFIGLAAPILGVWRALRLVGNVGQFLVKGTLGNFFSGRLGGNVGKGIDKVGTQIGDGLSRGIGASKTKVAAAASSMARTAIDTVKRILRIASPSRVFFEIGRNIALGLQSGIRAGLGGVSSAARTASTTAVASGRAGAATAGAAGVGRFTSATGAIGKASGAASVAAKGLGGAFKALGGAIRFAMGPLGIILLAVELLLPLIQNLWENNETFRNVVTKAWEAIKTAISAVWDFLKPVFEALGGFFVGLWEGAQALWDAMGPIWDGIKTVIEVVWNAVKTYFEIWLGFYTKLWEGLQFAWDLIKGIFEAIINFVVGYYTTLFNAGKQLWTWFFELFQAAWDIIKGVFGRIIDFVKAYYTTLFNVGAKIWNWFSEKFSAAWQAVQAVWSTISGWIGERITNIRNNAAAIWNWFSEKFQTAYDKVKEIWGRVVGWIGGLKDEIARKASGIWDGLTSGIKSALNFLIDAWNRLDFSIDLRIPDWIPGIGGRGFYVQDVIPDIPRLAAGGTALATPGGQLAILAEAGRNERIEPLDANGLSAGDRAVIASIARMAEAISSANGGEVRVFIGDQELRGMVRTEIVNNDKQSARNMTYSRSGVYSR